MASRKELGRRLLQFLFDYPAAAWHQSKIEKAVIFTPESIGDAMAIFPVIRSLQAYGCASIYIVCSSRSRVVFEGVSDRLNVFSVQHDRDYISVMQVARAIRRHSGGIDLCVDCTASTSSSIYFLGTLRSATNICCNETSMRAFNAQLPVSFIREKGHTSRPIWWREAMVKLGFPAVDSHFEFPLVDTTRLNVEGWLKRFSEWCVINSEGAIPRRSLSLETMREVIGLVREETSIPILLPFTEQSFGKACRLRSEFSGVYVYPDQTSIADTAIMVKGARFVISPDTAVVHISSAFNRPTIGFYLDASPPWLPLSSSARVVLCEGSVNNSTDLVGIKEFIRATFHTGSSRHHTPL